MYQFISTIFAATIAFSAFSAISATTQESADNSAIGTSENHQIVEQNKDAVKRSAQHAKVQDKK